MLCFVAEISFRKKQEAVFRFCEVDNTNAAIILALQMLRKNEEKLHLLLVTPAYYSQ